MIGQKQQLLITRTILARKKHSIWGKKSNPVWWGILFLPFCPTSREDEGCLKCKLEGASIALLGEWWWQFLSPFFKTSPSHGSRHPLFQQQSIFSLS